MLRAILFVSVFCALSACGLKGPLERPVSEPVQEEKDSLF